MNNCLCKIQNWPELAEHVNWLSYALSKECNVSMRTLERFFKEKTGRTPRAWLIDQRLRRAQTLLTEGYSVKETAMRVGYKHATHFSRAFATLAGYNPSQVKLSSWSADEKLGGKWYEI